jgi:glycerate dehydrogenase
MPDQAPKVVALDLGAFTAEVEIKRPHPPHLWQAYQDTPPERLVERLAGAAVAITNGIGFPGDLLEKLPCLELIACCATGLDHIDLAACEAKKIKVLNATDYATRAVAEHVFCLVLALKRSLAGYLSDGVAGAWQASGQYSLANHPISDLHGSRLGILGGGAIGRAVAEIGRGFAMEVMFAERKGEAPRDGDRVAFAEVLATSDILSLHCPLTDQTRNLIGRAEFRLMERIPLLINTARGGLVDEAALVEALREGRIAGAGFDVASSEPIASDNPLLDLVGAPNFILTPHVAWASAEAQQALIDQVLEKVGRFLEERGHSLERR